MKGRGYSTEASKFLSAWQALYEVTGKEIYLAKAITFANAMTVLQKTEYGGNCVATTWGRAQGGGTWPNCHTICARTLVKLGQLLKKPKMHVAILPEAHAKSK